jgi:peptidoglycan/xylan/chitin deacetylase (PgdA/CDA1 family)
MTTLTEEQLVYELLESKKIIREHGIPGWGFAYPAGNYNDTVLATLKKYYLYARSIMPMYYPCFPYRTGTMKEFYTLPTYRMELESTVGQIKAYIDTAVAERALAGVYFHRVGRRPFEYVKYEFNRLYRGCKLR